MAGAPHFSARPALGVQSSRLRGLCDPTAEKQLRVADPGLTGRRPPTLSWREMVSFGGRGFISIAAAPNSKTSKLARVQRGATSIASQHQTPGRVGSFSPAQSNQKGKDHARSLQSL